MPALTMVTLTGLDETSDLGRVIDMADRHPLLEIGILLSRSQAGMPGRYPSLEWIGRTASVLDGRCRLALHVCGRAVQEIVAGAPDLLDLAAGFDRVQINFNHSRTPMDVARLDAFIEDLGKPVITQHNAANGPLTHAIRAKNHMILFDSSGGMGVRADAWPEPINGKTCGFAGGIGPTTVDEDLVAIAAIAKGDFWIDMEGALRVDDRFDLDRCEQVLGVVDAFSQGVLPA